MSFFFKNMHSMSSSSDNPIKSQYMPSDRIPSSKQRTISMSSTTTTVSNASSSASTAIATQSKSKKKVLSKAEYFEEKKAMLYKTEICRSFEETGSCKFADECIFAHGDRELRSAPKHPKYKTEICKPFWENGACTYGKRCCFLHVLPEKKKQTTTKSKIEVLGLKLEDAEDDHVSTRAANAVLLSSDDYWNIKVKKNGLRKIR